MSEMQRRSIGISSEDSAASEEVVQLCRVDPARPCAALAALGGPPSSMARTRARADDDPVGLAGPPAAARAFSRESIPKPTTTGSPSSPAARPHGRLPRAASTAPLPVTPVIDT